MHASHSGIPNPTRGPKELLNSRFALHQVTQSISRRLQLKCDGTRWRTGGEVKGKLANGVGSQYSSHYLGTWCAQHTVDAHTLAASSRLNWRPLRYKWTRPFRWKTKSGFRASARVPSHFNWPLPKNYNYILKWTSIIIPWTSRLVNLVQKPDNLHARKWRIRS